MKEKRTTVLLVLISLVFAFLVCRLIELQLIRGQKYRRLAKENYIKPIITEAPRGIIYSRDGKILADNVPAYTVIIDSIKVTDEEYGRLTELFRDIDQKITLSYTIRKASFPVICKIEERKTDFPSVNVRAHPLRRYPYGEALTHLIGYVTEISKEELKTNPGYRLGSNIGKSGIEKECEKFLRGKDGRRYVEVDAKGREQGLLSSVPPEPGCDVWLNIDAELQLFAYQIMPNPGACVAMNPRNGEILLWVSNPAFNPNLLTGRISSDIWNRWREDSLCPLLDRVSKGVFPPASIFKLVTCATGLEQGVISHHTYQSVGCEGGLQIGRRKFECWDVHGALNLIDAIIHSCDVYFYQLGLQVGVGAITTQAKKVGFGTSIEIDIPGGVSGFMPSEEWYDKRHGKGKWGKGIAANIAIGQGEILVTPLQMLYFVSGIANNGVLCTPKIVKKIVSPTGEEMISSTTNFVNMPWKSNTVEILKRGMLGVVNTSYGTGRAAMIPGIEVAGKTGTAQTPRGRTHAWFAAFAPYVDPQICVVVFVEHGGMGGSVAAPIVGKILKKFFNYYPTTRQIDEPELSDITAKTETM